MHNLFLGLIKNHFRDILGLDQSGQILHDDDTKGRTTAPPKPIVLNIAWSDTYVILPENEQKDVRALRRMLQEPLNAKLSDSVEYPGVLKKFESRLKGALKCVCEDLRIDATPFAVRQSLTKNAYALAILHWVCSLL